MAAQTIFGIKHLFPGTLTTQHNAPLSVEDIYEVLDEIIEIADFKLQRVQLYGQDPHRIDVRVRLLSDFQTYIEPILEREYLLRSKKLVKIVKPFEEYKTIRVRRVPGVWDEADLVRIFSFYGTVKGIEEETMRPSPTNRIRESWRELYTGTYRLKMKVNRDIPSTLIVSRFKIEIFYFGQNQTCWRCGMAHRKSDNGGCKTEFNEFVNKFTMEDFPELGRSTANKPATKKNEDEGEFFDATSDHTYHNSTPSASAASGVSTAPHCCCCFCCP